MTDIVPDVAVMYTADLTAAVSFFALLYRKGVVRNGTMVRVSSAGVTIGLAGGNQWLARLFGPGIRSRSDDTA